jgi:WD40 repeat protein
MLPEPDTVSDRDPVLEDVVLDYLRAVDSGARPDPTDYLTRYPQFAAELERFFADQQELAPLVTPLFHRALAGPAPTRDGERFGDYELLGEIARGGMGVVYRARQVSLGRVVALKMIRDRALAGPDEVHRFRTEAENAARLDHPNIVPIYEVGEHQGQHYFSMRLIEGGSLAQSPRLANRDLAALMAKVARAVHHAHQRGILHRDLKPANVLLDARGEPHVTDFGLAKRVGGDDSLTAPGVIVGTPNYLAPELAAGERAPSTAVDVFGLGAILYALLTGRPPFQGATVMETLTQARESQSPAPRLLNPLADRDLETVCLKCLEKEAGKRYGSAAEVADDLERWLRGEPIRARPAGRAERLRKWARRRPAAAALVGVLAAALVAGTAGGAAFTYQIGAERDAYRNLADEYHDVADKEITARGKEKEAREAAEQAKAGAETARSGAEREKEKAERQRDRADLALHVNRLALAQKEGEAGNAPRALDVLEECRWDLRGWEWRHLRRRWAPQVEPVWGVRGSGHGCYSPDGRRLATGESDGRVTVRDAGTGQELFSIPAHELGPPWLAFSPDGRRLASAGPVARGRTAAACRIKVWDADNGRLVREWPEQPYPLLAFGFSSDGRHLAGVRPSYGGGQAGVELRLWDPGTGEEKRRITFQTPGRVVAGLAFSPDGRRVALATGKGVKVWDPDTGEPVFDLGGPGFSALGVGFSPDGLWLAACGGRGGGGPRGVTGLLQVWDARTGALRRGESGPETFSGLAFSPDGRHLAVGARTEIRVSDVLSGAPLLTFRGYDPRLDEICYRPDGQHLAGWGIGLNVWDARGNIGLRIATGRVSGLRFGPDSLRLFGTGPDGRLRCWDARSGREIPAPAGPEPGVAGADPSSDGRRLVALGPDHTVKVWDAATKERLLTLPAQADCAGAALSPDGSVLATIHRVGNNPMAPYRRGRLKLWAVPGGELLHTLDARRGPFGPINFSRDGRSLAAVHLVFDDEDFKTLLQSDVPVWDVATGRERLSLSLGRVRVTQVRFSPDGQRLATVGGPRPQRPGLVKLWDARTGAELLSLKGHTAQVADVCFSPDGRRLATCGAGWDAQRLTPADGEVKLWDVAGGQETLSFRGLSRLGVHSVCFSPDGRRLAAAGGDDVVRVWDGGDPWQAFPLRRSLDEIKRVGFSADGGRLVAQFQPRMSGPGFGPSEPFPAEVHAWDRQSGEEVVPCPDPAPVAPREATSPDGELLAVCDGAELRVWRRADLTPAARARRAEDDFLAGLAWHRRQAAEATAAGDWFAALFHLKWLLRAAPRP